MTDPYKTLKLNRSATPDEIREAYQVLVKKYHPDRNFSKAAPARFKQIQEAYDLLSDPAKRARYDATGDVGSEKANNEDAEVLAGLSSILAAVLSKFIGKNAMLGRVDMVAEMNLLLVADRMTIREEISRLKRIKKDLQDAVERFVVLDGSENVLQRMVRDQLVMTDPILAQQEARLVTVEKILAFLKKFGYKLDFARSCGIATITSMGVQFILEKPDGSY